MRKIITICTMLIFLFSVIYSIYQKEETLKHGMVLRLELAPVDPRSLMQGDYMRLHFSLVSVVDKELVKIKYKVNKLIIKVDKNKVGTFSKFKENNILENDELVLNFTYTKYGNGDFVRSKIGITSYFFEEGKGKKYEHAIYGEFMVNENGEAILQHLLDKSYHKIKQ